MKHGRRALLGLADQGLSSLTNFALALVVVRSVSKEEFGAFSIALAVYMLGAGLSRAATSSPLVIRFSGTQAAELNLAIASAAGTALAIGLVLGVITLVACPLVPATVRPVLFVVGLSTPGLMLQDCWRNCFLAQRRPGHAIVNDAVWAVVEAVGFVMLEAVGRTSAADFLAIWGMAGTVAALAGCLQLRLLPMPQKGIPWLISQHTLALPLALESLVLLGVTPVSLIAVGAIVGLGGVGMIRAATVVFSPLNTMFVGALFVGVPEAARLGRDRPGTLDRLVVLTSLAVLAGFACWTAVAYEVAFAGGAHVLGAATAGARGLFLPTAIVFGGAAAGVGPQVGFRAKGAGRTILACQGQYGAAFLILSIGGAFVAGVNGAAYGGSLAALFSAVVWWSRWARGRPTGRAAPSL